MSTGWTCPSCGRGVAPSEKTCDHTSGFIQTAGPPQPVPYYLPAQVPAYRPELPLWTVTTSIGDMSKTVGGPDLKAALHALWDEPQNAKAA